RHLSGCAHDPRRRTLYPDSPSRRAADRPFATGHGPLLSVGFGGGRDCAGNHRAEFRGASETWGILEPDSRASSEAGKQLTARYYREYRQAVCQGMGPDVWCQWFGLRGVFAVTGASFRGRKYNRAGTPVAVPLSDRAG